MFTVEITANDDGTYTVTSESEAVEAGEGQEPMEAPQAQGAPMEGQPEAAEPAGQTVNSIKEALTLALDALKNGGKMSDMQQDAAEFDKGFGAQVKPRNPVGAA